MSADSRTDDGSEPDALVAGVEGEPGMIVAGRYRLTALLGAGGMGSVWVAWDSELERSVAVKLMAAEAIASAQLRERFNREAKAAAGLRTRHVVEIYDFGVDEGRPFIVMELLEGEDLRQRLRRRKRLSAVEVAHLVAQAARALQKAAEAGIVHRDLKPANVYLAQVDDEEVVKLLDFGVAKRSEASRGHATKSGILLGSPPYMSPEQARGKPLDHRSDVWALAAIAYRALTGRVPFTGDNDGDIIVKICTESPPPPSQRVPGLPPAIDTFFVRAFEHDPARRFQTAGELSAALLQAAGAPPPRASLPDFIATPDSPDAAWLPVAPTSSPSGPRSVAEGGAIEIEPEEALLTTPITGVTQPVIGSLRAPISPSGAPASASTASTWEAPLAPRSRAFVWLVAGVCGAALLVIGAAVSLGDRDANPSEASPVAGTAGPTAEPNAPLPEPATTGSDDNAEPEPQPASSQTTPAPSASTAVKRTSARKRVPSAAPSATATRPRWGY